jgi:small subunit ribosomal protein S18
MAQTRDTRGRRPGRSKYIPKRRICFFCRDKIKDIDYKDPAQLRPYISDRGKIAPRRKSGACARHQRMLAVAIKRARHLALLPYVSAHIRKTGGVGLKS